MSDTQTPPQTQPPPEQKSQTETKIDDAPIGGTYSTEHFEKNNIPYCKTCGEAYHSDLYGGPVCAEPYQKKCPRLK